MGGSITGTDASATPDGDLTVQVTYEGAGKVWLDGFWVLTE